MPYIEKERRDFLAEAVQVMKEDMRDLPNIVAGDLNYIVFSLAKEYIRIKGLGYNNVSDAIKALTGAAHEVERRILDPYEDSAIGKNGDVE